MATTKPKKAEVRENSTQPEKIEDIWKKDAGMALVSRRNFKLECRRGKFRDTLNFDSLCSAFTWSDTGPLLSGSASLTLPARQTVLDVQQGDLVACQVTSSPDADKGWQDVWRMRVSSLAYDVAGGQLSLGLVDELHRLMESTQDFSFKKDKKHPNGWYCHQIAKDVLDEYGVPVGKLMKGKHRIKRLTKQGVSPLDIIQAAYAREKKFSAQKVVIKFRGGKFYAVPLHYSKFLYEFAGTLTGATLTGRNRKKFATVLEVIASDSQSKSKKKKYTLTVKSKKLIARFGRIVKTLHLGDVDSKADAREEALRHMKEVAEPKRDLSVTHPGIPSVARGDAVKINLPDQGFKKEVLFIKEVTHSVAPGSYEMEIVLSYDDPVRDAKEERECAEKCKKAREQNRPLPKDCNCPEGKSDKDKKQPEKNKNRESKDEGPSQKRADSVSN